MYSRVRLSLSERKTRESRNEEIRRAKMVGGNGEFKMRSMILMVLTTMAAFGWKSTEAKIVAKLDVALVVGFGWPVQSEDSKAFSTAYTDLVSKFQLGEMKVAVVHQMGGVNDTVLLELTDVESEFQAAMTGWGERQFNNENGIDAKTAMSAIKSLGGFDAKHDRRRMVVMPIGSSGYWRPNAIAMAEKLREEEDVLIYTLVKSGDKGAADLAESVTGDSRRVLAVMAQGIGEQMENLKIAMLRDACEWKWACEFDSQQQRCEFQHARSESLSFVDASVCDEVKPSETCEKARCEETCDKYWPWANPLPDCDRMCGQSVMRSGREPVVHKSTNVKPLRNCPTMFQCSPCTIQPPESTQSPASTRPPAKKSEDDEDEDTKGMVIGLVVLVVFLVTIVLIVIISLILAIVVAIRQHRVEKKKDTAKIDELMETIRHMSIHRQSAPAADAALAADLPSTITPSERLPLKKK